MYGAREWITQFIFNGLSHFDFVNSAAITFEKWGENLTWELRLFDQAGVSIHLDRHTPFRRSLKRLRYRGSSGSGLVLFNDWTCLDPLFRGKGLGPFLQRADESFARKFGVRELQLNAGCDALKQSYWQRKEGYRPSRQSRLALEAEYSYWQEEHGGPADLPIDWAQMPSEFVDWVSTNYGRDGGTIELFKKIL